MTENTLTIAYISLSGNTQSFVKRFRRILKRTLPTLKAKLINIKELKHETFPVTSPFYRSFTDLSRRWKRG